MLWGAWSSDTWIVCSHEQLNFCRACGCLSEPQPCHMTPRKQCSDPFTRSFIQGETIQELGEPSTSQAVEPLPEGLWAKASFIEMMEEATGK